MFKCQDVGQQPQKNNPAPKISKERSSLSNFAIEEQYKSSVEG
jgi:hypothetical protein